eukprot:scaffold73279_cov18-Tisochrysis_lutea.AAC.3
MGALTQWLSSPSACWPSSAWGSCAYSHTYIASEFEGETQTCWAYPVQLTDIQVNIYVVTCFTH